MDLRISLQKLDVLSQVVRRGGVGRAAEALHVAQPVVTAHIRSLEERLGAKLFYREGRQIHLTEAGDAVHGWAEDVLTRTRELDRYLGGLAEGQQGSVALGASMSIGSYRLPYILSAYRRGHPKVDLRLTVSDTEHILEDAREGLYDFAFVVSAPDLEIPGMSVTEVATDPIVLVAAAERPQPGASVTIAELSELPFIEAPEGIVRRTFIDRKLRELGVGERNVVLELGHPEAMKRAVLDGLGVSLLFRSAAEEQLEAGTLREIAIEGGGMALPIYIAHRMGKSFSPLQQDVMNAIRAELEAQDRRASPPLT